MKSSLHRRRIQMSLAPPFGAFQGEYLVEQKVPGLIRGSVAWSHQKLIVAGGSGGGNFFL
jgi:hypothetical protein